MRLLHPRRIWRSFLRKLRNGLFVLRCRFRHVDCRLGKYCRLEGCRVFVRESGGRIVIADNCNIRNCTFAFYGEGGSIVVGESTTINARRDARTGLCVKDATSIRIGERGLISNSVEIATTDWHRIYDSEGNVLNPDKDVQIGSHVWCGRKVTICKGVSIPDHSVIGACSLVTKPFEEPNVVIAGNPAEIKKRGIRWHL